jgi:xylose isomerase
MPGLDFSHTIGQALDAGKLFHIDLNGQKPGRYDQDLRFGSEDQKAAFFLVKVLEDAKWPGMRHFDSHAYRTEDEAGVWDFAYYSMRTYNILKEKVARFHADSEIQALLQAQRDLDRRLVVDGPSDFKYSPRVAQQLLDHAFDLDALRTQGFSYERLDQLTTEVLLGVR